jgi:hypothetical protein
VNPLVSCIINHSTIQRASIVRRVDQSKDHEGHIQFGYFVVVCSVVRVVAERNMMGRVDGVAEESDIRAASASGKVSVLFHFFSMSFLSFRSPVGLLYFQKTWYRK